MCEGVRGRGTSGARGEMVVQMKVLEDRQGGGECKVGVSSKLRGRPRDIGVDVHGIHVCACVCACVYREGGECFITLDFKVVAGHPLVGDPLYCAGGGAISTPHPELKVGCAHALLRVYACRYMHMCPW